MEVPLFSFNIIFLPNIFLVVYKEVWISKVINSRMQHNNQKSEILLYLKKLFGNLRNLLQLLQVLYFEKRFEIFFLLNFVLAVYKDVWIRCKVLTQECKTIIKKKQNTSTFKKTFFGKLRKEIWDFLQLNKN